MHYSNCFKLDNEEIPLGTETIQLLDKIKVINPLSLKTASGMIDIKFDDRFNI